MKTFFTLLVVMLAAALPSSPQTNGTFAALQEARRALETPETQPDDQTEEATKRHAAAVEAHKFEVRLAEFAHAWNDFVKEYSDRGTYNLKKAKSLSRALKNLQADLPK